MSQVGVDPFHRKRVAFVYGISYMPAWIDYIYIPHIAIRSIHGRFRRSVHHVLNGLGRFIQRHFPSYDLPWQPTLNQGVQGSSP